MKLKDKICRDQQNLNKSFPDFELLQIMIKFPFFKETEIRKGDSKIPFINKAGL